MGKFFNYVVDVKCEGLYIGIHVPEKAGHCWDKISNFRIIIKKGKDIDIVEKIIGR